MKELHKKNNPIGESNNPIGGKKEANKSGNLTPNVHKVNRNKSKKYAMNPSIPEVSCSSSLERRNNVLFGQPDIATVVKETGEIIGKPINIMSRIIDTNNFAKLFIDGWAPVVKLLQPQFSIFIFILKELKFGQDEIIFDKIACEEYTGYSQSTINRHLALMIELGIIYESRVNNKLFINAAKFWIGNRVNYITKANAITQNVHAPKKTKRTIKPPKGGKIIQIDDVRAKEQGV